MAHYRKALKIKPDYAEAHYNLGLALAGCGRVEEAIAHYQKALQLKPDYAMALNDLAWLRATCPEAAFRNGAAAIELAQRAISLSGGKTPEMLDTLAAAYAEAGMFSKATETVCQALDLARQQNKTVLVEKLKSRLWLYDVGTPYREAQTAIFSAIHRALADRRAHRVEPVRLSFSLRFGDAVHRPCERVGVVLPAVLQWFLNRLQGWERFTSCRGKVKSRLYR